MLSSVPDFAKNATLRYGAAADGVAEFSRNVQIAIHRFGCQSRLNQMTIKTVRWIN